MMPDDEDISIPRSKAALRHSLLARRNAMVKEFVIKASEGLCLQLSQIPELAHAKELCTYYALRNEIDAKPYINTLLGVRSISLPRVTGDETMCACKIHSWEQTEPGRFGIPTPTTACPEVAPQCLDVIFVPGLAFGRNGHRLGYGAGYYDRYLEKTKALKIGLAYDFQIVASVPSEPHDVPLDVIVTPTQVLRVTQ